MIQIGTDAPLFMADSTHGTFQLADYAGKRPIVLIFYPMDNTPGCTKQLCAVRDSKVAYAKFDAVVVGINPASVESHQGFADKHQYNFPILSDRDESIRKMYGITKFLFLMQQRVVIVVGKNGQIIFAEKGLRPTEEILAVLATDAGSA
ncbi:peroxiredoxin [Paenibacillus sp. N1-5-1-14]|uniref:peroxiredoxin n=1 Tax=Paenibacillus radicibacter TaxID=2972488 RepID=UPI002158F07D|nr:peroxiredoxin [Paenibacillus radicibacter]MCR8643886.1 peroxiredoxin [Paenibacillus radicibacter]